MESTQTAGQSEKVSAAARRELILGHATTWHDPAWAFSFGDHVFAEAVERHAQCKRALQVDGAWYSWRTLNGELKGLIAESDELVDVTSVTPWSTQAVLGGVDLTKAARSPLASMIKATSLLEPITINQLKWMLRGHPPRPFGTWHESSPGMLPDPIGSWTPKTLVHQLAHASNAVYTSSFDECVVMVIDGYSEATALSFFQFKDNDFHLIHDTKPEVSLGLLYAAVTQFCGFDPYAGEEWKVMGLAAYGERDQAIYDFFKQRMAVDGLDLKFRAPDGRKSAFALDSWRELESLAGGFRKPGDEDILRAAPLSRSFQEAFVDTVVELAANLSDLGLSKNLAYAGGCALNSAANGRFVAETGFERLHVPSAPGDDGNALGAMLHEKHCVRGEPRSPGIMSPYLGSRMDTKRLDRIVELGKWNRIETKDEAELLDRVTDALIDGAIIGWVQGRAEFGPRALGNRSIIADPRRQDMKEQINARVKFREFYRPLAPSILAEHGPEYFEGYQESPYMERTLTFKTDVRDKVPAVVHEDGTGRLQSVTEELNPRYYRLISRFNEKAGVPVLLNTSLNVMGKPIVHSVEDAVNVFATTGLDLMVIEGHILTKDGR